MAMIGKIIGGSLGFIIGGPIGALAGAAAGHAIADKKRALPAGGRASLDSPQSRQATFLTAAVILAAKLCKVDGKVTRDEIGTIRRVFEFADDEIDEVGALFNRAKQDSSGYRIYAQQIYELFGNDREMCRNLVGALTAVAAADGTFHPAEKEFIVSVAVTLRLSRREIEQLFAVFARAVAEIGKEDPYAILGVSSDASDAEVKAAHRKILKDNHPDLMMARGMPEELTEIGNRKLAAANAAYDMIKERRKSR